MGLSARSNLQAAWHAAPLATDLDAFDLTFKDDWKLQLFRALPLREQECVVLYSRLNKDKPGEFLLDISQCITRCHPSHNIAPCFTGTAKPWMIKAMRVMRGQEMLALQGMSLDAHTNWHDAKKKKIKKQRTNKKME